MLGDYAYGSYFIFFFFIFLFASLRCVHIHILLQIFLFPVKHPFPVKRPNLRFHGSPHSRYFSSGLTAAFLPLYASFPDSREELQMMIPFEQWRHFFFFFLFFLSLQKIQDRRSPIQFSTWIKKTVHVSRPFFFFFFFLPLFPHFQTLSNELFLSVTLVAGYSLFSALLETKRKRN